MLQTFRLPDPGEGLVEADIVTWRVAVGDDVQVNDIVVEIETSKSLVELPIPYAGKVTGLLVSEGDTVDVGAPIITIEDGVVPAEPGDGGESDRRVPNLVGYGVRPTEAKRRPRKGVPVDGGAVEAHEQLAGTFSTGSPVSRRADQREPLEPAAADAPSDGPPLPSPGEPAPEPVLARVTEVEASIRNANDVLAKPPVRKLAKDLGVELASVSGTGDGGIITREDVQRAAEGPSAAPAGAADAKPAEESRRAVSDAGGTVEKESGDARIPIKGVRKATATAMVQSAFSAPHVSVSITCDVSATMELVERLRGRREFRDIKVGPLLIVAKAVCLALGRVPELNSTWLGDEGVILLKRAVNLGIAAATPRGLLVPNIKGAQALDLRDLAEAINALVGDARNSRTPLSDLSGGTFTITNIGVFGVDAGTPILNPGESGILCVGTIARRPWVVGAGAAERIEPRWVTTLTLSFDHRLADGEQGSKFLAYVADILSEPGLALLF